MSNNPFLASVRVHVGFLPQKPSRLKSLLRLQTALSPYDMDALVGQAQERLLEHFGVVAPHVSYNRMAPSSRMLCLDTLWVSAQTPEAFEGAIRHLYAEAGEFARVAGLVSKNVRAAPVLTAKMCGGHIAVSTPEEAEEFMKANVFPFIHVLLKHNVVSFGSISPPSSGTVWRAEEIQGASDGFFIQPSNRSGGRSGGAR